MGNEAPSFAEVAVGLYNTPYAASNAIAYNDFDRLFSIGNGTSPTNRSNALTMLKNGNTSIGDDQPGNYKLKIKQSSSYGLNLENTGTDDWELYVSNSGANLNLYANASFRGSFDFTTGVYTSISDERLKTNIQGMGPILSQVLQLQPKTYTFKEDQKGKKSMGFLAQEVEKIFPELVRKPESKDPREAYYSLDYTGFGILAIKAIQEQQTVIESQQAELDAQRAVIQELLDRVKALEDQ